MHFHLPKPLHGWRAFVGEVGIIVVGVLIALSAEQVVERFHWRHEVASAKDSLAEEISSQYFAAAEMEIAQPCIDRQLKVLEDAALAPGPYRPVTAYTDGDIHFSFRAPTRSWSEHVWQSVNGDGTAAHFDRRLRLELASMNGLVDHLRAENATADALRWRLVAMARTIQPDAAARAALVGDIEQARGLYAVMALVSDQVISHGQKAGFPAAAEDLRADGSGTLTFCRAHHLPLGHIQPQT